MLKFAVVALIYALLVIVELFYLADSHHIVAMMWLPSGLGLAIVLLGGNQYAYSLFTGALTAYLLVERPFLAALLVALSNTLEALLGTWLLNWGFARSRLFGFHRFNVKLIHPYDYLLLALAGSTSAVFATFIGVSTLWQTHLIDEQHLGENYLWWWMGNFLGIILITPLVLVWQKPPTEWWQQRRVFEALLCLSLSFLVGQIVFLGWLHEIFGLVALGYWLFLFVTWSAVRLGRHGVTVVILMIAVQVLLSALHSLGLFANIVPQIALYKFWFYILVLTTVGTTLALAISARDCAENELRTLSVAIEQSPASIVITDLDATIQYVNPCFTKVTGYSSDEAIGQNPRMLHSGLTVQSIHEELWDKLTSGQLWSGEFINRRKNGEIYWEHAYISPVNNALTGKPTHYVAVKVDVTERKHTEQQLQTASAYARGLIETSLDPLVTISVNGKIMDVNKATEKVTGLSRDRLINTDFADYFTDSAQARAGYLEVFAKGLVTNYPLAIKHQDGTITEVLYNAVVYRDDTGEVAGVFAAARDITELKRAEQRERSRNQVLEFLANDMPLHTILELIIQNVETENPCLLASILLLNERGQHFDSIASIALPSCYTVALQQLITNQGKSCCADDYYTERIIVENIQQHPCWQSIQPLAPNSSIAACWSEPILSKSKKVLGVFTLYAYKIGCPNAYELSLLEQMTILTGVVIEHCRAREQQQLAALVYHSSSEGMAVTDASNSILTVNPAFTRITGYTASEVIGKDPKILGSGQQNEAFYAQMWQTLENTGRWQGELWNRHKNGENYAELLTINTIFNSDNSVHRRVALFSDITEKKKSDEMIWRQANFDALTALPNRHMFHDRLNQEIKKSNRTHQALALMFLDLDRFKEINDTLGHDMGDILLKEAALRLKNCVRSTDTVARLGGDEFVVIFPKLFNPADIDRIAKNILLTLAEPFFLRNKIAYVSASIGIALYPDDAKDAVSLIKNADQAMYSSKETGRNCHSYFTPSMQEAALTRRQITDDLRSALRKKQFCLFYQPIVALDTAEIHKAEALIRWQHPTRGLIYPEEFIAIAEETRMIIDIGNWVFQQAAGQVAQWRETIHPNFQISVNKSPVQFQSKFHNHALWFDYLDELGLSGQSIVVEITEGLLLDAHTNIIKQLLEFRDAGIQVSLDDFGTGYCSLSYLKKFDIDYLKIDQSFVKNLASDSNDLVLCEAIIVMAHKLGIKVIAEGIETKEQRDLLITAGCDYGQGYFFAKPQTAENFEQFLKTRNKF
ncbi:MAG: EAL domain-containing protein [Methylococcaceae bacterium]